VMVPFQPFFQTGTQSRIILNNKDAHRSCYLPLILQMTGNIGHL